MERTQATTASSLSSLREEMAARAEAFQNNTDFISLRQAFDRLVVGARAGAVDASGVEDGVAEIRASLSELREDAPPALMPPADVRTPVLARNYADLAGRILDAPRGSWDTRHLEMVQGAVSALAGMSRGDASAVASRLQDRMSRSVWVENVELADGAAGFERAAEDLRRELADMVADNARKFGTAAYSYDTREGAGVVVDGAAAAAVDEAVGRATRGVSDVRSAKASPAAATGGAGVRSEADASAIADAADSVREAASRLLARESERLSALVRKALRDSAGSVTPQQRAALDAIVAGVGGGGADVESRAAALREMIAKSGFMSKDIADDAASISARARILGDIVRTTPSRDEIDRSAQEFEARTLYERRRMRFERDESARMAAPVVSRKLTGAIDGNIVRLQGIAGAQSDMAIFAPNAGSGHVPGAARAARTADGVTPMAPHMDTLWSEAASRAKRLTERVRQLAFHPSVRAEMGFASPRFRIENQTGMAAAAAPLFKRVKFNPNNKDAGDILPALYGVSGIKINNGQRRGTPLRKSDASVGADNLEIVKNLESQIDGASDRGPSGDAGRPEKWEEVADSLRSEAGNLPASVVEKLAPYLGFDVSHVKIYAGPVAAAAAESLGAKAFTIGKHVFMGGDAPAYDSPEGLALLAHELLHTSHYGSHDSVDSKEQAAESMEARVRAAFGSTDTVLAVEKSAAPASQQISAQAASSDIRSVDDILKLLNPDLIFEDISDRVIEMIYDSIQLEKDRKGIE